MLLRIFPGMPLRNVRPVDRHRPIAVISDPSNFRTAWCGAVLTLGFIFYRGLLLTSPSHGLMVQIRAHSPVMVQSSPWKDTLGVDVKGEGQFLVNGEPVKRDALAGRFQKELGKRVVWTVYFEADPGTAFHDTVYGIDAIQGLGRRSSGSRQRCGRNGGPPGGPARPKAPLP